MNNSARILHENVQLKKSINEVLKTGYFQFNRDINIQQSLSRINLDGTHIFGLTIDCDLSMYPKLKDECFILDGVVSIRIHEAESENAVNYVRTVRQYIQHLENDLPDEDKQWAIDHSATINVNVFIGDDIGATQPKTVSVDMLMVAGNESREVYSSLVVACGPITFAHI